MSLDVSLYEALPFPASVCISCLAEDEYHHHYGERYYSANITHNVNTMAMRASLYTACWHPETLAPVPTARDILPLLVTGVETLRADPAYFKQFNPKNGWGNYDRFVAWVEKYASACSNHLDAVVLVSR